MSGTQVVGRHGEALLAAYEDPEMPVTQLDQLDYGNLLPDEDELRRRTRRVGLGVVADRSGVPSSTLSDWVHGAATSADRLVAVAMAVDELDPADERVRACALEGCDRPPPSPRAKWCTPSHRAAGSRVTRGLSHLGGPRTSWAKEAERERAWRDTHP